MKRRTRRDRIVWILLIAFTLTSLPLPATPPESIPSSFPSPWASIVDKKITNSADVAQFVGQVLKDLHTKLSPNVKPVLLLLHPRGAPWNRLIQELATALARYGVEVEGLEVDLAAMDRDGLKALEELSRSTGLHTALEITDNGTRWERWRSRLAGLFGLQQVRDHFRNLRAYRQERRAIRKEFEKSYDGDAEHFETAVQKAFTHAEHYPYFKWVPNLPQGIGGGWKKQLLYLGIASVNTYSFSLLNTMHRGLPEIFLWSFTYLYQMGQDYINYLRKVGRVPRWYTDSSTGERRLTTDLQQTYSRALFFLVTWGIVFGCNLLVVAPIGAAEGASSIGPWLERTLENATLGVCSFAFIDAFFSRLRQRQLTLLQEVKRIEDQCQREGGSLEESELAKLRDQAEKYKRTAGWYGFGFLVPRTFYYGGIYPFFKHDHLWGNRWKQYILVVMGIIGFMIDLIENGVRLNWFGLGQSPPTSAAEEEGFPEAVATPLSHAHTCATHLIVSSREQIDSFRSVVAN